MSAEAAPSVSALTACERCHRRKARCDKVQPACSSCVKVQAVCQYTQRNPAVRRDDVEKLERRLRQAEARNDGLLRQLQEARQSALPRDSSMQGTIQSQTELLDSSRSDFGRTTSTSNTTVDSNEIASQVSDLSLKAGAERQFLGSASGLLLATLLHVDTRSSTAQERWEDRNHATITGQHLDGSPLGDRQASPKRSALPPENLADHLLTVYLAHDHLSYPILHPTILQNSIKCAYNNEMYYEDHPVEAFTIDMVFAISTAQVVKFDRRDLPEPSTHYRRAMYRLKNVFQTGGIVVLQAILLICQYRMLSASHDTSTSIWHLIGVAARMCLEMGLHRESTYHFPHTNSLASEKSYLTFAELKRRCFWSVFAVDRIVSLILGRPLAISLDDIDTELPKLDIAAAELDLSTTSPPVRPAINLLSPTRTAIFVHIVRYRTICGKMLSNLHNVTKARNLTAVDFADIRLNLAQELELWHRDIESLPELDADLGGLIKSTFGSRDWYKLLYHNGVLTLYRPSPEIQDLPHDSIILQRIFDSAKQSITSYGHLHRTRKINYTWMTLHAVFIAGLSYAYALRTHFQTRRQQMRSDTVNYDSRPRLSSDPTIGEVVSETRACTTVLVAISEHWNYARNCHLVFGRLSDAILADVVQFFTKPSESDVSQPHASSLEDRELGAVHQAYGKDTNMQLDPFSDYQWSDITDNYRNCFTDFQGLFENSPLNGNEILMQASQPWLFSIEALDGSF